MAFVFCLLDIIATLPEHPSSPPVFNGVRVTQFLVLYVYFVDRCFSFFFWPLCCLSYFDLRNLITPLVSPNSSFKGCIIFILLLYYIVIVVWFVYILGLWSTAFVFTRSKNNKLNKQLLLITPTTKWIFARLLCERHETRFITYISSQDLFECIVFSTILIPL